MILFLSKWGAFNRLEQEFVIRPFLRFIFENCLKKFASPFIIQDLINEWFTKGIQQGHMKMHLMNILNQHKATKEEKQQVLDYFKNTTVSHSLVVDYLEKIRS